MLNEAKTSRPRSRPATHRLYKNYIRISYIRTHGDKMNLCPTLECFFVMNAAIIQPQNGLFCISTFYEAKLTRPRPKFWPRGLNITGSVSCFFLLTTYKYDRTACNELQYVFSVTRTNGLRSCHFHRNNCHHCHNDRKSHNRNRNHRRQNCKEITSNVCSPAKFLRSVHCCSAHCSR